MNKIHLISRLSSPCLLLFLALVLLGMPQLWSGAESPFSYAFQGELVTLHPSARFIAVKGEANSVASLKSDFDLMEHSLSDQPSLQQTGFIILQAKAVSAKKREKSGEPRFNLWTHVSSKAASDGVEMQPVFEQGGAILIPFEEITIGFEADTDLAQAQAFLETYRTTFGLLDIRAHRPNTFICRIDQPAQGRCYAVSRALAELAGVQFAEPNHILLRSDPTKRVFPEIPQGESVPGMKRSLLELKGEASEADADMAEGTFPVEPPVKALTNWTTIAFVDFDNNDAPNTWKVDVINPTIHGETPALATWDYSTNRKRSGTYSVYCASAWDDGVPAPGPAPVNMHGTLATGAYNLTSYEEVYLDFWFWAENEVEPDQEGKLNFYDYATLHIGSVTANQFGMVNGLVNLYVEWEGENYRFAQDPTSQGGWMHLLYRVPDSMRQPDTFFEFRFHSDGSVQKEGVYLDDIRLVGTTNVDVESLGNDTYAARHWDKRNTGQIAGYGAETNDLRTTPDEAWSLVNVSQDIVLAIVDDGVELTHPDLNLATGYDYNGTVGGAPRGEQRGSHGTSCAGDAGAIRNNSIGVIGQAPGCKIMPVYVWGPTEADTASAIGVAVAQGARILSNSWGWVGAPNNDIANAISAALAANRIVLFAAGNGPDRPPFTYDVAFPGNLTGTTDIICVGASSPTDEHKSASSSDGLFSWGSSYVGAGPDICAPGPWSYTTDLLGQEGSNPGSTSVHGDYTHDFGGTSSATPKVAGIVALMLSKNPSLTPAQVKTILKNTADPMTATGTLADMVGAGRVNAYNAIQAVDAAVQNGAISCTISPADAVTAGAQWNVDGGAWQNSGATVSNLAAGTHTVSFKITTGWAPPANQTVTVTAGQTTTITGTYTQAVATGGITCTISPADAVAAGAQWNINSDAWQNSSATVSNLAVGTYTISFKAATGWTPPANQTVTVAASQTTTITGTYTQTAAAGAITCTISPADAVNAGAQWRVDSGAWQTSGATVSGLAAGAHTVSFVSLSGWTTPANQTVNVAAGQTASISTTYTQGATTSAIICNITPAEAVNAGAQWRVDNGAWQASGATVSGLSVGAHTLTFVSLAGWTPPETQTVNTTAGQATTVSAVYASIPTTGSITCTITPEEAVNAGAQWRVDDGAWQASGATATGIAAGAHTVSFVSLAGWTAPANQNVSVVAGQTNAISGVYTVEAPSGCNCKGDQSKGLVETLRKGFGNWLLAGVSLICLFALSRRSR